MKRFCLILPATVLLAKWVVNAVFDATGELDPARIEQTCSFIQFVKLRKNPYICSHYDLPGWRNR